MALALLSGTVYGQVPSGNDTSDANFNTGMGTGAINRATTGTQNTASGDSALHSNTTGSGNNAMGYGAMYNNTTGSNNSAQGRYALSNNTTGHGNAVVGAGALRTNTTGSNNTAAGIAPPGEGNSEKLQQLRPVSFHLKSDPKGAVQYGLIAEEVANVYPELVVRDSKGRIDGVRYDELAPMLLNEVQQQQRKIADQDAINAAQAAKIASLEQQLAGIQAVLVKLQPKDQLVAQR
jgi:Chaperone of endosialidase